MTSTSFVMRRRWLREPRGSDLWALNFVRQTKLGLRVPERQPAALVIEDTRALGRSSLLKGGLQY